MSNSDLYAEREKRVLDAISLRTPDRVPIVVSFGFFPVRNAGMTIQEGMYDGEKLRDAHWKVLDEFQPDMAENPFAFQLLGPVL